MEPTWTTKTGKMTPHSALEDSDAVKLGPFEYNTKSMFARKQLFKEELPCISKQTYPYRQY